MKMFLSWLLISSILFSSSSCIKDSSFSALSANNDLSATTSAFPSDAIIITLDQLRKITTVTAGKKYFTSDEGKTGYWALDAVDKSTADNTGTVVVTTNGKRFKRVYKDTVIVSWFGALGNNVDCTKPMQAAINAGKIISIPDGNYLIQAGPGRDKGIWPKSGQTFLFSKNAIIKMIPVSSGNYYMMKLLGVTNVTIDGGSFVGDREGHGGSGGEWGHVLGILNSTDITIKNVTCRDAWGDGIYVGSDFEGKYSERITIDKANLVNCRRNGMSVVAGKTIKILNSNFYENHGISPQAGLDLEPNPGYIVSDVTLKSIRAYKNAGAGVESTTKATNIVASDITAYENRHGIMILSEGINTFENCVTYNNLKSGVYVNFATNSTFKNSRSYNNGEHGYHVENAMSNHKFIKCVSYDNMLSGFEAYGDKAIVFYDSCTAKGNKLLGFNIGPPNARVQNSQSYRNGKAGMLVTNYAKVINNHIYENGEQGLRIYGSNGIYQKNRIHSNSQNSNASRDNIEISSNGSNNLLTSNVVKMGTLAKKPRYGIMIPSSTCLNNTLSPNDVTGGGVSKDIYDNGSKTIK